MPESVGADDDGRTDRPAHTAEPPAARRRLLLVAGVLILLGAVFRFLTLYSLEALLAVFGVGRPQPFPSVLWSVNELAHLVADAISTGMLWCGLLLLLWHLWSVRKQRLA